MTALAQAARVLGLVSLASGCSGLARVVERPDVALRRYADAVQADDAEAAYALLDEEMQAQVSPETFRALMTQNRRELGERAEELRRLVADGFPARAKIRLRSGETVTLLLEDGRWVVSGGVLDAPALGTPRDAVMALRRAVARRSMRAVERVLARQPRAEMEAEIDRLLEETEDELDLDVEVRGDHARVRTTGGREILLVRQSGEWRVLEIR